MISQTVGALISAAAEELLVIDSGNSLTTQEQASAIDRLNRLIDSTNLQRPLIFSEQMDPLTLVANQQSYTIGIDPTGTNTANFSVNWPTKIERANLLITTNVRRPIRVIDEKAWAHIRYQNVSGPPRRVYFDRDFGTAGGSLSGFGTLWFYPIPDQAYPWEMYSWRQNPTITSTSSLINYPPGYADYWLYGAVIRLASMFGRTPSQTHIQLFRDAQAALMSQNCPSPELVGGDFGDGGGLYNWLDGQTDIE